MDIVRGSLAVIALAAVACSSASSSQESPTDAGTHLKESGGGPVDDSGGNFIIVPKVKHTPEECAGRGTTCSACCEDYFTPGAQYYRLAEASCVCAGKGTCVDVCSALECSSLRGRSKECSACITQAIAGGCEAKAKSACDADDACKTFLACMGGC